MNNEVSGSSGRFHTVQPLRDLESNWAVDLAKNLEEYLLKICSGEISGEESDENSHFSVNFAEAALLLQGSIQVYSRKVEYLYSLVLHVLEFVSQKRQHDQPEGVSARSEEADSSAVPDEEDNFWGFDDIPVETKNSLDISTCKDTQPNHFVKPPANLVVLEGDCLDATGDVSELETYLLATNNLYRDFILLDPCDAISVNDHLKCDNAGKGHNGIVVGSSLTCKSRKRFQSPITRSGGTGQKSAAGKKQDGNLNPSPPVDRVFTYTDPNIGDDPPPGWGIPENSNDGFEMDAGDPESGDSDDEDDPWKPLNPHEHGNLGVKPFKKVKSFLRHSTKRIPVTTLFPFASMCGTISPELSKIWEALRHASDRQQESKPPPLYEKLRHSLVHGGRETCDAFSDPKDDNECDFDMPESRYEYEEVPLHPEKQNDEGVWLDSNQVSGLEDPSSQASLEDLCRSHLDALLASIAETEKQTELAARVSSWKHRIETNLEEQGSRPPFDIGEYGDRVLEKLSVEMVTGNTMSFTDIVRGQEKHDVARTFSSLLQLVNNGNVCIVTSNDFLCYTATNPFHVRLLSHNKKHEEEVQLRSFKKRAKSPTRKGSIKIERDKTYLSRKFPPKLAKVGSIRCTPEGKRRRRSPLVEPMDLPSAG